MKYLLLFLAAAAPAAAVFSAPHGKAGTAAHQALQPQLHRQYQYKTTAVQKRLKATNYQYNGADRDSNLYIYSNGRGSASGNPDNYFSGYYMTASNPVQHIKCDSAIRWINSGAGLDIGSVTVNKYDAQNRIINSDQSSEYYALNYAGTYNSNGDLAAVTVADTFGGTAMIPKTRMDIVYDNNKRRISDSNYGIITGVPYSKRAYKYDGSGNLLEMTSYQYYNNQWTLTYKTESTFDNQNRATTSVSAGDYGQGYMMQGKDSFAYTGTATHPTYHKRDRWDNVNNLWDPEEVLVYNLNSSALPDTYLIIQHTTQWDTVERDVYIYDSNDLLIRSNGYYYYGGSQFSPTPYDQTDLYFEEYYPQSVAGPIGAKEMLSVYPNPAKDKLNITLPAGNARLSIYNIQGQAVAAMNTGGNAACTADISNLQPGSYIIHSTGADGYILQQGSFIKH